jgi:hypothetical protein
MTGIIEIRPILAWIRTTLLADTTLVSVVAQKVYEDPAPEGTAIPYVVMTPVPVPDVRTLDNNQVFAQALVDVREIDFSDQRARQETVANRIDAKLDKKNGAAGGVTIYTCSRVGWIDLADQDPRYRHLGATYRIQAGVP